MKRQFFIELDICTKMFVDCGKLWDPAVLLMKAKHYDLQKVNGENSANRHRYKNAKQTW